MIIKPPVLSAVISSSATMCSKLDSSSSSQQTAGSQTHTHSRTVICLCVFVRMKSESISATGFFFLSELLVALFAFLTPRSCPDHQESHSPSVVFSVFCIRAIQFAITFARPVLWRCECVVSCRPCIVIAAQYCLWSILSLSLSLSLSLIPLSPFCLNSRE